MKLEDVSWHEEDAQFPEGLPEARAATHIGMFVAWAISNGLWSGPDDNATARVRNREITGARFVLEQCDGKLFSDMLNDDGRAFAEHYFPKQYYRDYQNLLAQGLASDYLVEDTWENYDRVATLLTQRYDDWKNKPHWKFW